MNPVAFSIFGFDIRWYGIIIACGILIAIGVSNYTCLVKKISNDTMVNILLISLPLAILGARLYYVIFNWNIYKDNIINVLNTRQGGLAIHGGVIVGLLSAYIYTRIKKINFLRYADAAVPCIILAQSIGRWGNFFNGEAHGSPVSYEFIKKFPYFIQKGMYMGGIYYNPTGM